jgi:hypothetical protein
MEKSLFGGGPKAKTVKRHVSIRSFWIESRERRSKSNIARMHHRAAKPLRDEMRQLGRQSKSNQIKPNQTMNDPTVYRWEPIGRIFISTPGLVRFVLPAHSS